MSLVALALLSTSTAPELLHTEFASLRPITNGDYLEVIQFIMAIFPALSYCVWFLRTNLWVQAREKILKMRHSIGTAKQPSVIVTKETAVELELCGESNKNDEQYLVVC